MFQKAFIRNAMLTFLFAIFPVRSEILIVCFSTQYEKGFDVI